MKLSILTMFTSPEERQDKWREALENYSKFADEVIVVDGTIGGKLVHFDNPKVKIVGLGWVDDWKWEELPRHLNFGKKYCTGDWILKLDIDQFTYPEEKETLYYFLQKMEKEKDIEALKLIKLNYVVAGKYYSKGSQPILFRNKKDIGFGFIPEFPEGDLCMPMKIVSGENDTVPVGKLLKTKKILCHYWNFGYCFKDKKVSKELYWKMVRAYREYYKDDKLGHDLESSFEKFMEDCKQKVERYTTRVKEDQLPYEIRHALKNIKRGRKGHSLWGYVQVSDKKSKK